MAAAALGKIGHAFAVRAETKVVIYFVKGFALHSIRHHAPHACAPARVEDMSAVRTEGGLAYAFEELTLLVVHHDILYVAIFRSNVSNAFAVGTKTVGVLLDDGTRFHLNPVNHNHLTIVSVSLIKHVFLVVAELNVVPQAAIRFALFAIRHDHPFVLTHD